MCGISGKLYFDEKRTVASGDLRRMSSMLEHRGPDGEGIWTGDNVGLAHRRLAIIDLSPEAGQPMCNEDGTVWITFNGEIYNFQELRVDLQARGHVFRTNSDTEAIIHAYEQYGRECLDRLRGMFAFAIWDRRCKTLFLARDRVGKKPIFYYLDGQQFLFASEIKGILADRSVKIESNATAIDHYLAMGYVPSPLSAFRGMQKLPAAHWLEIKNGRIEIGRYWRLRYVPKRKISLPEATAELQSQLADAVRLRLMSDVPLGAFLSGGVDSSAIVAYMARAMDTPVRTFSVGFEEESFDERPFARMVAERYGTNHTELVVKAPVADILPRVVWQYDEPFADPSAVPSYAIAQLTRRYVTVVLNGDGGDESFAGYNRYLIDRLFRRVDLLPSQIRRGFAAAMMSLPGTSQGHGFLRKLAKVAELIALEPERRYARWFGQFTPSERQSLYTEEFKCAVNGSIAEDLFVDIFAESKTANGVDADLSTDVNLYLPDDLLVKMDRASMAHSLEARSPLLDHVFMEFVATLPPEMKLSGNQTKHIFKQSLRGALPDVILDRPKMGFGAPISSWFRNELREMAEDLLLSARTRQRGYFRAKVVEGLWVEHISKELDHSETLWTLLVLELWHRIFLDGGRFTGTTRQASVSCE
jgi:asparagine synthase (glutamine-hydrolysing)